MKKRRLVRQQTKVGRLGCLIRQDHIQACIIMKFRGLSYPETAYKRQDLGRSIRQDQLQAWFIMKFRVLSPPQTAYKGRT